MWELIFWTVLYSLAVVGFGFIVALICMFIRDGWHEQKRKRAFDDADCFTRETINGKIMMLHELAVEIRKNVERNNGICKTVELLDWISKRDDELAAERNADMIGGKRNDFSI